MKRCPTCQRTYTDDSLTFCLQDGAPLLSVGNPSQSSYDQGAQTEILPQPVPPTIVSPRPDSVTVPQQRVTNPSWADMGPQPAATAPPPATRNRALTVGLFVIALLLLGVVGIGVALLMRDSPAGNDNTTTAGSKNGTTNRNENQSGNENANGSANTKSNANSTTTASPSPVATTTPPVTKPTPGSNTGPSQTDSAARAEAKILANTSLTESDLAGLSQTILRRLRNAVYARHGRTFNTPEIQSYFNSRPWYRPRSDYSDADLTATDRANVQLIQAAEGG